MYMYNVFSVGISKTPPCCIRHTVQFSNRAVLYGRHMRGREGLYTHDNDHEMLAFKVLWRLSKSLSWLVK